MKYNPKMNEKAAALPDFSQVHPHQPVHTIQGALALMHSLQQALEAISGLDRASLQPAAGAQGELVGLMIMRAYCYMRRLGAEGLKRVSEHAVLHANYVFKRLKPHFHVPYNRLCMHEFVISGKAQRELGVRTLDMAKRLLDYGVHAPTIYFPLIVEESLMVEPTETESLQALDEFIDALIAIAKEARERPDVVQNAPHSTVVKRLDEARAARELDVCWRADP